MRVGILDMKQNRGRYGGGELPFEGAGRTLRVLLAHAAWVA
jgi:hypothetical protein